MADPLQLAELVCARFSHDVSGLLGSLNGVLELAVEAPGQATEEVALASKAAAELVARLRLLRAAWGGVSEPMDLDTLRAQMRGLDGGHRMRLDLDGLADRTVFAPPMARLILNVVMLARDAMPRGGVLTLSGDPANHIVAQIVGPDAAWPKGFALCIADEPRAWTALGNPRELQAPLTAIIARAIGIRLSWMMAAGPTAGGAPPPLLITAPAPDPSRLEEPD
jgi:histidine phosphotransferase ChpT